MQRPPGIGACHRLMLGSLVAHRTGIDDIERLREYMRDHEGLVDAPRSSPARYRRALETLSTWIVHDREPAASAGLWCMSRPGGDPRLLGCVLAAPPPSGIHATTQFSVILPKRCWGQGYALDIVRALERLDDQDRWIDDAQELQPRRREAVLQATLTEVLNLSPVVAVAQQQPSRTHRSRSRSRQDVEHAHRAAA